MNLKRSSLALAVLYMGAQMASAETESLALKWSELSRVAAGRQVTLILPNSARVEGTVESVQPEALVMNIVRSSDKKNYAPGQTSIARGDVSELRIKEVKGHARIGAAAGVGALGSLLSLSRALSEERVNVSDNRRITEWVAISAASVTGGYLLGRLLDTHETLVKVLRD